MTPLKPGAARAAAQAQLGPSSSVVAVCVEGLLSLPDYNGVFLPVGGSPRQGKAYTVQQAWPRFETAEGKHLFRQVGVLPKSRYPARARSESLIAYRVFG